MCIGIPMQVVESGAHHAWCRGPEGQALIDLALVGPQEPGTWLLTFLGAAREVLDPAAAAGITAALTGLAAALAGDQAGVDAAFADLSGRTPELPEHLRKAGAR
jgi:hydrogenase expression/formation protein HypC